LGLEANEVNTVLAIKSILDFSKIYQIKYRVVLAILEKFWVFPLASTVKNIKLFYKKLKKYFRKHVI